MKLKVLSWNIWCGTYLDQVIEFLKNADADIIALQEVAGDQRGNIADIIAKKLGYEYVHAVDMDMPLRFLPGHPSDEKGTIKYGNAILSRHKIIGSKIYELSRENNFRRLIIRADLEVGADVLSVFSIHLRHTHQQQSAGQDLEAENLLQLIPSQRAVVLGDFNSLPDSTVIQRVGRILQDTEASSVTPTWSVYNNGCTGCLVAEVKYKLDYIFTSRDIKTDSFKVHESKGSDHLPLSAVLEIPE